MKKQSGADPKLISYIEKGYVPKEAIWIFEAMVAIFAILLIIMAIKLI